MYSDKSENARHDAIEPRIQEECWRSGLKDPLYLIPKILSPEQPQLSRDNLLWDLHQIQGFHLIQP